MVFAGALGAAVYAQQLLKRYDLENESEEYRERADFSGLERKISNESGNQKDEPYF